MGIAAIISLLFMIFSSGLVCASASATQIKNELRPFATDGCSVIADGTFQACCIEHDLKYWVGGTVDQRLEADTELRQCVFDKTGSRAKAWAVYQGVRLGGGPEGLTSYRFGYGWKYMRPYAPLSDDELFEIDRLMPTVFLTTPVTRGDFKPLPLPSESGNYCVDDGATKIAEMIDQPFTVQQFTVKTGARGEIKGVIYTLSICKGSVEVSFEGSSDLCTRLRYKSVENNYMGTITGKGNCARLIKK